MKANILPRSEIRDFRDRIYSIGLGKFSKISDISYDQLRHWLKGRRNFKPSRVEMVEKFLIAAERLAK